MDMTALPATMTHAEVVMIPSPAGAAKTAGEAMERFFAFSRFAARLDIFLS
jgi:hypothetical protein